MKIAEVIYSLELGGAEKLVVDLSNKFSVKHEVYLITFKDDSDPANLFHFPDLNGKVNYINLKLKRGINLHDILKVYRTLKKIDPDVVHCHLGVIFHVLLYTFFNRRTKYFHTIHNDAAIDASNKAGTVIRRYLYKKQIFTAITISDISRESFNKFYRLDNSKMILNGRVKPEKTARHQEVRALIDGFKRHPDDLVFLHVGRHDSVTKNQQMLVRVFNRLINEGNRIILLLVGNDYDLPEGDELKKSAGPGIYFCGPRQNIADWYLNADAFCLSSRFEGMPISLIEALACGCTPVCTPVGGIVNIVTNEVNGFLSADTGEESYFQAVKTYLGKKNSIKKEDLKTFFNQNYTIEKCAEEHEKIYFSF